MRIAVEGCSHGELDKIYATVRQADERDGKQTHVLLLCGDLKALRNVADFECLAVPAKYRHLGDFHRYYTGQRKAPLLTLVIGGNHEASNYMWELFHGGWLAPNIYYLGAAGCVDVGGLLVAGISGIYKSYHYKLGRFEKMPLDHESLRSIYHTREYDIFRLSLLDHVRPTITLSHDWPNTIEQHGETRSLLARKPFFRDEVRTSTLGSPPLMQLLRTLRPPYWFSAHLHVKFAALYKHDGAATRVRGVEATPVGSSMAKAPPPAESGSNGPGRPNGQRAGASLGDTNDQAGQRQAQPVSSSSGALTNAEQIDLDLDDLDDDDGAAGVQASASNVPGLAKTGAIEAADEVAEPTRFLALSQCLAGQHFLQILDVPAKCDADESFWTSSPAAVQTEPTDDSASTDRTGEGTGANPRQPTLRFSLEWLAITKATHHLLCLSKRQYPPLPGHRDGELRRAVAEERSKLAKKLGVSEDGTRQAGASGIISPPEGTADGGGDGDEEQRQHWDPHPLAVRHQQRFMRTAPGTDEPQGSLQGPPPWYTNQQTQRLCEWLGLQNKINPPPEIVGSAGISNPPPPQPFPPSDGMSVPTSADVHGGVLHPMQGGPAQATTPGGARVGAPAAGDRDDEAQIARIRAAASAALQARKRKRDEASAASAAAAAATGGGGGAGDEVVMTEQEEGEEEQGHKAGVADVVGAPPGEGPAEGEEVLTLDDNELEGGRWKEGTG